MFEVPITEEKANLVFQCIFGYYQEKLNVTDSIGHVKSSKYLSRCLQDLCMGLYTLLLGFIYIFLENSLKIILYRVTPKCYSILRFSYQISHKINIFFSLFKHPYWYNVHKFF